ncbi:MAG TPA: cysteine synthase A [Polyangiaceae bacterium]|jgi:cysteine synthase A|nr:cysteine synthase A [Polyangiaceae bacterium]
MTEGPEAPSSSGDEPSPAAEQRGIRAESVLELIGRTPLVRLTRMEAASGARVWGKAEFLNPAGSVKDRPALSMIQAAEDSGKLRPGATLIEATSGNTGISLAMISAVRGYRCVLVMPEDMSLERRHIMRAYGAEIALTAASDGMLGAVRHAEKLLRETPGAFMPRQFENPANPASHYRGTANEILAQLGGCVDAFVAGVGTGGTLTGVARCLRERLRRVQIVAVEPKSSAVLSGGRAGPHSIQGLGAGFVPPILDRGLIDEIVPVSDAVAERTARRLAEAEGLLVGPSAGANVYAACAVAQRLPPSGNVVTILCDSGERYLF